MFYRSVISYKYEQLLSFQVVKNQLAGVYLLHLVILQL